MGWRPSGGQMTPDPGRFARTLIAGMPDTLGWSMITMTGIVSLPSWPGLSRPSAHQRQGADGRDKPVHDGETRAYISSYRENGLVGGEAVKQHIAASAP